MHIHSFMLSFNQPSVCLSYMVFIDLDYTLSIQSLSQHIYHHHHHTLIVKKRTYLYTNIRKHTQTYTQILCNYIDWIFVNELSSLARKYLVIISKVRVRVCGCVCLSVRIIICCCRYCCSKLIIIVSFKPQLF